MPTSIDLNFPDVTTATLVAGRGFFTERKAQEWQKLCTALDGLAAELQLPLVLVIGTDLSAADADEDVIADARVGLWVATAAGPEPQSIDWSVLRTAVSRAAAIPWPRVAALCGPMPAADSALDEDTGLWLVPTGPLAGGFVAFGVPADDESELVEWSVGSPQSREPKLEYIAGHDMDQTPLAQGVWGVSVLYRGDWESGLLDISDDKHRERQSRLGSLAPRAGLLPHVFL